MRTSFLLPLLRVSNSMKLSQIAVLIFILVTILSSLVLRASAAMSFNTALCTIIIYAILLILAATFSILRTPKRESGILVFQKRNIVSLRSALILTFLVFQLAALVLGTETNVIHTSLSDSTTIQYILMVSFLLCILLLAMMLLTPRE